MNCCEKRYKIHLELPRRILNNKNNKKKKYTNNAMPRLFLFLHKYIVNELL